MGPIRYPTLMSQHQLKQGYVPSLQSMFSPPAIEPSADSALMLDTKPGSSLYAHSLPKHSDPTHYVPSMPVPDRQSRLHDTRSQPVGPGISVLPACRLSLSSILVYRTLQCSDIRRVERSGTVIKHWPRTRWPNHLEESESRSGTAHTKSCGCTLDVEHRTARVTCDVVQQSHTIDGQTTRRFQSSTSVNDIPAVRGSAG